MTTAIDTTVIIALWDASDSLHRATRAALDKAFNDGTLVVSGAVYAELVAGPGRTEAFVDRFCVETGIAVEWGFEEKMWRTAGTAFQGYAARRRKQNGTEARPILADFVIGAHALVNGYKLLTLDGRIYKAAFPRLGIVELG
jgi:predicted nucleic acid-binding protein